MLVPKLEDPQQVVLAKDLPKPTIQALSRNYRHHRCPKCRRNCYRDTIGDRKLHDVGSLKTGRPHVLEVTYSVHRCEKCKIYFSADMSDLAPFGGHYTHRVMSLALRAVLEDSLPYQSASWRLWRDHCVFVPWATIQNWVEGSGKKKTD
jgi:transposase